jgi:polysaccharide biosynthesis transport protein
MDTRPAPQTIAPEQDPGIFGDVSIGELIERLTGFVRRQFAIFVFVICFALGLGLLYLVTTPPSYTAHATLVIDTSKMRVLQQQQQVLGDIPLDTSQVETQVEVLKSDGIGLAVVKDLRLAEDAEFMGARGRNPLGAILGFILGLVDSAISAVGPGLVSSSDLPSESALMRKALGILKGGRQVTRVGRTYALDIAYTSLKPAQAAAIANAFADAYISDQLESKYQTTRRASTWLQERIKDLRSQATAADVAILEYKEKNNIVDFGGSSPTSATGARLIGEQELGELTTQLGLVRNTTTETKAKLERIKEVMRGEIPDAVVADSLRNDVINKLRQQYLDLSTREGIWSSRYGPNHQAAVNARTQMNEIKRSITDELARISEGYRSDYEIAKTRQEQLEKNLAQLVSSARVINRDRLGLRDLESQAQVHHTIYESFLQRYMEAVQQQSFPITEARVISAATPPTGKSGPDTLFVLFVAGSLGIIMSFAIGTVRDALDRVFRTTRQIEETLRTTCLTVLPLIKAAGDKDRRRNKQAVELADQERKLAAFPGTLLRQVVDHPLSSFAESIRAVKVAADIAGAIKSNKVIGVTSAAPREGKSTVSCNFAQLIAHAGKRVALVDGDLRNPTLSHSLTPNAKAGLLEVIMGKIELSQALYSDPVTKLDFVPVVKEKHLVHTSEILASDAFKELINALQKEHDYVIVDLPPLAPVVDARATTNTIDSYLYVVEWGKTRIRLVQDQLAAAPELSERLLGVILNKANLRVLGRYEYYYGTYSRRYYGRVGYGYRHGNYPG